MKPSVISGSRSYGIVRPLVAYAACILIGALMMTFLERSGTNPALQKQAADSPLGTVPLSSKTPRPPATMALTGVGSPSNASRHLTSKARIYGIVSDTNGFPIRHAVVTLNGPIRRTVLADPTGKYEFDGILVGEYTIAASKTGFVSLEYGQPRPFEPSRIVRLGTETVNQQVDFYLPHGAAIVGSVTDEFGDPAPNAVIKVLRFEYQNGRNTLIAIGGGPSAPRSDELGRFRVFGVPAGDYLISASVESQSVDSAEGAPLLAYAETYFPSTTNPPDAKAVTTSPEREAVVDIRLIPASSVRVSGLVTDASGEAIVGRTGIVRLTRVGASSPIKVMQSRFDGSFDFVSAAAPGDFVLAAQITSIADGESQPTSQLGRLRVTLAGRHLTGVRIRLHEGATIAGQVVVEDGEVSQPVPPLRVFARPIEFDGALVGSVSVPVGQDGRFVLRNIFEPSRILTDLNPNSGWRVKTINLGEEDISESGVSIAPGQRLQGVKIVLTQRMAAVTGAVSEPGGQVARDCVVLLFAEDQARWRDPDGRFVRFVRADTTGKYSIVGLPSGQYRVAALRSMRIGSATDPAFLRPLRSNATRVELLDAQKLTLNLSLTDRR
jgi:hypothetical protein